jgi:exopolysaccharide biosynthesis WecB/TagA/CpsF family protein
MTGFSDRVNRRRLNGIDLVLPDGQPVRWALNWIHRVGLRDRVRGSQLTLEVVEAAAKERLPVYFYGSSEDTLRRLVTNLRRTFPQLVVAGAEPSVFRRLSQREKLGVIDRIKGSGARLVVVGLGCPRQEAWVYEYRDYLDLPLLAVGAAFSFLAGELSSAPHWMQNHGLEWLYRLAQEPGRLWKRYLLLGPVYLTLVLIEALGIARVPVLVPDGTEAEESYG